MTKIHLMTKEIRDSLKPVLGEDIQTRMYFSYYGLFKDNAMFGIYKDHHFYLRVSSKFREQLDVNDFVSFKDQKVSLAASNYVLVDDDFIHQYPSLILDAIEEIKQETLDKAESQKNLIRNLPNMNLSFEKLLYKNGITSPNELDHMGAIDVFIELVKQGYEPNEKLLFKLYGAASHKHHDMLTKQEKYNAIQETNKAFYTAGLRHKFALPEL